MAPADHGVDSILHWELQLEGGLAGPGGVILTGERRGAIAKCSWRGGWAPGAVARAWACSPGPAHLLTLAIRSRWSPSTALGETSKVAMKVT